MWILLWLLLSLIVMGVFFWSTAILQKQKKAWSAVAKKMSLVYNDGGRYMASPSVTGRVGAFGLTLTTDQLPTNDAQGQRSVSALEIEMGAGMPTTAVVATPGFAQLLANIDMAQSLAAEEFGLPAGSIIRTFDTGLARACLTPDRLKTLQTLFGMKNAQILFFLNDEHCIVRIETSDPLIDAGKLEKLIRRMALAAETLKPTPAPAAANVAPAAPQADSAPI